MATTTISSIMVKPFFLRKLLDARSLPKRVFCVTEIITLVIHDPLSITQEVKTQTKTQFAFNESML